MKKRTKKRPLKIFDILVNVRVRASSERKAEHFVAKGSIDLDDGPNGERMVGSPEVVRSANSW